MRRVTIGVVPAGWLAWKSDGSVRRERFVPYLSRLYGYALSLSLNADTARDLVQDAALRALEARRQPADEAAYRAWLFAILRNRFLDQRRRAGRAPEVESPQEDLTDAEVWDFDAALIDTITVRSGMRRLSRPHREIIALVDIAGFSYGEAARLLDVPAGTVMSRISRARRTLLREIAASNVRPMTRRVGSRAG